MVRKDPGVSSPSNPHHPPCPSGSSPRAHPQLPHLALPSSWVSAQGRSPLLTPLSFTSLPAPHPHLKSSPPPQALLFLPPRRPRSLQPPPLDRLPSLSTMHCGLRQFPDLLHGAPPKTPIHQRGRSTGSPRPVAPPHLASLPSSQTEQLVVPKPFRLPPAGPGLG